MAKRKDPTERRQPETSLSEADIFYIEHHGDSSVEDIAQALGKPVQLIQDFADDWNKKNPPKTPLPRARRLLQRYKGTVGMTEGSSMVGDDTKFSHVTLESIQRAHTEGRYEDEARLRREYDEKMRTRTTESVRTKFNQMIHRINPSEDPNRIN